MKEEKWNPNEYQGKSRKQVEGANYGCVGAGFILLLIIGLLIVEHLIK